MVFNSEDDPWTPYRNNKYINAVVIVVVVVVVVVDYVIIAPGTPTGTTNI